MKQLSNLKAEVIDIPDIRPPNFGQIAFRAGGIAVSGKAIMLYTSEAVVSLPLDEIIRLAKEADPRVDLTKEGIKSAALMRRKSSS